MSEARTIALVELYSHHELLIHFCRIIPRHFHIMVFTTPEIFGLAKPVLNAAKLKVFVKKQGQSIPRFLRLHMDKIQKNDFLIMTSLFSNFIFFGRQNWKPNSFLIIHNANTFFNPYGNMRLRTDSWSHLGRDLLRLGKILLLQTISAREKALLSFDRISLTSKFIQTGLSRNRRNIPYRFCSPFPLSFYDPQPFDQVVDQKLRIVIPGAINTMGRDFHPVLDSFRALREELHSDVELTLLGCPRDDAGFKVLNDFRLLSNDRLKVVTFDGTVPQAVYDRTLRDSNFLILPLNRFLQVGIFREEYGFTNISGTINDLIRFCKPALLPDFYPLDPALHKQTGRYRDSKQLTRLLREWLLNPPTELPGKEFLTRYSRTSVQMEFSLILRNAAN